MLDIIIITPTIGRDTLINTIDSIKKLKINNWKSIIIFDGIKNNIDNDVNIDIDDDRFIFLETEKKGEKNYAGLVRNVAFDYIIQNNIKSKFICFVDDDDTLSPYYINNLNKEIEENKNVELIIFRMMETKEDVFQVLPRERITKIIKLMVGISFCIKYDLIKYKFINNQYEDYYYLKNIESNKHKIIISSYVNYFVRNDYKNCERFIKNYPIVKINF